jgi:hypothetical protein
MQTIYPEFVGSMERIRNNFYLSFLALNFVNLRPFDLDVVLPVEDLPQNIMTFQSLNSFDNDGVQEYGNSIRRHFLNDVVIAYERYSMLMIASHKNRQFRTDPCQINYRMLGAHLFEQLPYVYQPDDIVFLAQLRRFRNTIVHYNGIYSATNELNYVFGAEQYNSIGKEGKNISVKFDTLLWIYDRLRDTIQRGNTSYFVHY